MATKNEIIDVLRILYTAYDKQPDKDIASVYINTLDDLPAFALEQAAYKHIKTSKWFPKVGELRELALRVPNEAEIKARDNYRMTLDPTYQPTLVNDIVPPEREAELQELNNRFMRGEYEWIDGLFTWKEEVPF